MIRSVLDILEAGRFERDNTLIFILLFSTTTYTTLPYFGIYF